jgi:preprotein translocase YajC subunit
VLPLVLIFVVFWFLLIRPQQKKMKQHREMIAAVRRGDRVLTGGGIVGTVTKVLNDTELQVEIAEVYGSRSPARPSPRCWPRPSRPRAAEARIKKKLRARRPRRSKAAAPKADSGV